MSLLGEGGMVSGALGEALLFSEKEDSQDFNISRYSSSDILISAPGSMVNLKLVL